MFENVQSNPASDDPNRMGGTVPKNRAKRKRSEMNSEKMRKLHGRLMNWYMQERERQIDNRIQQAIDEAFYDGEQWTPEEIAILMDRMQAPLVYNQIKPTVNWLLGTERRTRKEGKVLPREEADEEGAEAKTKLLKFLSDQNRLPWARSRAFKDQIVAGLGWMEDCINADPSEELLKSGHTDWKNIYHDSIAKDLMPTDWRYIFRWTWTDLDQAIALCPDRAAVLRAASIDSNQVNSDQDDVYYMGARVSSSMDGDYARAMRSGMAGGFDNGGRERVKLIECWYRDPVTCQVCRSDDPEGQHLNGQEWNPDNEEMAELYRAGFLTTAKHTVQKMRVAIFTESDMLYEGESPYKHNRFPFTPFWCYKRAKDGMPYGVVRDIRDAQKDYNKRASKALHILSAAQIVMDKGAVDDIEVLRDEAARPDAIIEVAKNHKLEIVRETNLAAQHVDLMRMNGQAIRDVGGVTDQNLGNSQDGMSGKAIGKLQDQGTIVTAAIFDNQRLGLQWETEIQLSLIEQYYTAPKVLRVIGENKPTEWMRINQWDEVAGKYLNDITRTKADYIVGEQDFRASTRQAMFESMMDLVGKLPPEHGLAILDMVIDFADVPNKDEIVARIRKINGQADPTRKPTPDEEAALAAQQQEEAEMKALNKQMLQAQVAEAQAKIEGHSSKAQLTAAQIKVAEANAVNTNTTAAYQAIQAAQVVATMPGITVTADAILAGAGYEDMGGTPAPIPEADAQPMQPDPMTIDQDMQQIPELQQADGAMSGIETATPADNFNQ